MWLLVLLLLLLLLRVGLLRLLVGLLGYLDRIWLHATVMRAGCAYFAGHYIVHRGIKC